MPPTKSASSGRAPTRAAKRSAGQPGQQGQQRRVEGERTRELLMDAAEELFAAGGIEGVSIRSVNAAAGLSPASVHYHFGDKDGLVRAVIARRGTPLVRRQAELLDVAEDSTEAARAEDAVRLLADPMYELLREEPIGGGRWLTILAGLVAGDDERVYQIGFGPGSVQVRINARAAAAFPGVDGEVVADRWRMASTALLGLLAGSAARLTQDDEAAARAQLDKIVRFVSAGLEGATRG